MKDRIEKYDTTNGIDLGMQTFYGTTYKLVNRRVKVCVAEDGGIIIDTKSLVNGKIITHSVGYSPEASSCIVAGIFKGDKHWANKRELE